MSKIANCISSIRKQKGISQQELAEKIGVTARTLRKWENGSDYPRLDQAFLVAQVLGIPVERLFFYID
jgi:transcriptional regulator with XRE-family HTH domain